MKTMAISEFKAKCIAVMKEVRRTRTPLIVAWRGEPIARIEPIVPEPTRRSLGSLQGQMQIEADIVQGDFDAEWEGSLLGERPS